MKSIYLIFILLLTFSPIVHAGTPTNVIVHVLSNDAKLIGSSMGGAWVTIRDVKTNEVLSKGKHLGSTGDTNLIVKQPKERGVDRFLGEAPASYMDTLSLERPTLVEITAEGPLAYPQAMQKASVTTLLIPGKHLTGEGVVLTLHGFIVDIMAPESVDSVKAGGEFTLTTSVRMMCGCPTSPGGLWDSNDYEITAYLIQDDKIVGASIMEFSGKTNIYQANMKAPSKTGNIVVLITASDVSKTNFGMDQMTLKVN